MSAPPIGDEAVPSASSSASLSASRSSPVSLCRAWHIPSCPHSTHSPEVAAILTALGLTESPPDVDPTVAIAAERRRILRFHFEVDRVRALTAKLALAATLAEVTSCPASDLRLSRSSYGKPLLRSPSAWVDRLAFNLSHHGDWVVLAVEANTDDGTPADADAIPLLGCDVTTHQLPASCASADEYLGCFADHFTTNEWKLIRDTSEDQAECELLGHAKRPAGGAASMCPACQLVRFAWLWSLKESLIKAIGMGLSFPLQHIEFAPRSTARRLFSPIGVTFIGSPEFDAPPAARSTASSSPAAAASSSSPASSVASGVDSLATDVAWEFDSTLLRDTRHIVTRCRGWKRRTSSATPPTEKRTTSTAVERTASPADRSTQLLHSLGDDISVQSTAGGHLRVYQLSYDRILPALPGP